MEIIPTSKISKRNTITRAGIIPYCTIHKENYYFLCIDSKYGSIIDPGGHLDEGEDFISAAVRELCEETFCIFNYHDAECTKSVKNNSIASRNYDTVCIFQYFQLKSPLPFDEMSLFCEHFRIRYLEAIKSDKIPKTSIENSYMIWVSESDLKQVIKVKHFSNRVPLPISLRNTNRVIIS